jgi:hypothetical protein
MRDSELTERPGRGWSSWKEGPVDLEIDRVWWAARCLNFAKLNVSCWFDGSDLVAIEHLGFRRPKWTMKNLARGVSTGAPGRAGGRAGALPCCCAGKVSQALRTAPYASAGRIKLARTGAPDTGFRRWQDPTQDRGLEAGAQDALAAQVSAQRQRARLEASCGPTVRWGRFG